MSGIFDRLRITETPPPEARDLVYAHNRVLDLAESALRGLVCVRRDDLITLMSWVEDDAVAWHAEPVHVRDIWSRLQAALGNDSAADPTPPTLRRPMPMSATKQWSQLARQIAAVLFDVPPCPDAQEPGRACRYCEAEAVAAWITRQGGCA